jgi:hypothetical protein
MRRQRLTVASYGFPDGGSTLIYKLSLNGPLQIQGADKARAQRFGQLNKKMKKRERRKIYL